MERNGWKDIAYEPSSLSVFTKRILFENWLHKSPSLDTHKHIHTQSIVFELILWLTVLSVVLQKSSKMEYEFYAIIPILNF